MATPEDAIRQMGRQFRAANEAQIALPEQIERLNQQTGELLKVAEAQKKLAEGADVMTRRLVRLTWGLLIFTIGLFGLTVGLLVLTYYLLKHG